MAQLMGEHQTTQVGATGGGGTEGRSVELVRDVLHDVRQPSAALAGHDHVHEVGCKDVSDRVDLVEVPVCRVPKPLQVYVLSCELCLIVGIG